LEEPTYDEDAYTEEEIEMYENQGKYGVMFSGNMELSHVECTEKAYGDSTSTTLYRSLAFHTPLLELEKAIECIHEIPQYNAFSPELVSEQLSKMPDDTKVAVGREGSPVLYIWTDRPELLINLFQKMKEMEEDDDKWTSGPNEFHAVEGFPKDTLLEDPLEVFEDEKILIRAWWD